ncbi:uncharacterized protein [Spinacia oleracea]|uniref:Uncharacterized protein isoform X3 n=1 Tax=Spinacia oleracea TaxID=3562 RepID=A0ABM3RM42_SPIOL|nr:uncharacterized protein LOC130470490 isoform X3 [Spinacia oleracea]
MKWASRTAPEGEGEPSIAALWSVLEIWMYEHFPTLAPDRTGDAAYPYAASWIGAVRRRVPLSASRRTWRVLFISEVLLPGVYRHMWYLGERVSLQHSTGKRLVPKDPPGSMLASDDELAQLYLNAGDAVCLPWENFVDRRGRYEDLLGRLAPPVRFVLPEEEVDLEDIPYADRVIRYENSNGEQVEVTIPVAFPPHRRSYDAVPEHYAAAPRVRVRRWMLLIDSLKRHCAKLTQNLSGRDREIAVYFFLKKITMDSSTISFPVAFSLQSCLRFVFAVHKR